MAHIAELLQTGKLATPATQRNLLKKRSILAGLTVLGMGVVGLTLHHASATPGPIPAACRNSRSLGSRSWRLITV